MSISFSMGLGIQVWAWHQDMRGGRSPFIPSLTLFLSSCRSEFLTYIIFLLSEELLLTFLDRQIYKILKFCLSKRVFCLHFFFEGYFAGHRILDWWVSAEKSSENLIFVSL